MGFTGVAAAEAGVRTEEEGSGADPTCAGRERKGRTKENGTQGQ